MWTIHQDQRIAYDVSGLGMTGSNAYRSSSACGRGVNTDSMTRVYELAMMQPFGNLAKLDGEALTLDRYADDVVQGFDEMYRFLMAQRDALLAAEGPLRLLGRESVRFVFRATRVYAWIQGRILSPESLRDGADRSIAIELLTRAAMPSSLVARAEGRRSIFWPVFQAERRAMERGDVPFFQARPDNDALRSMDTASESL